MTIWGLWFVRWGIALLVLRRRLCENEAPHPHASSPVKSGWMQVMPELGVLMRKRACRQLALEHCWHAKGLGLLVANAT